MRLQLISEEYGQNKPVIINTITVTKYLKYNSVERLLRATDMHPKLRGIHVYMFILNTIGQYRLESVIQRFYEVPDNVFSVS